MALQIKRGLTADLPQTAADGELLFATDTNKLYVGNSGAPQEVTGGSSVGGDSVLNSALIGNVSIISNEISAVDAYGNDATLVVASEMQVNVGSLVTETINGDFGLQNPNYGSIFYSNTQPSAEVISKFVSGTLVTITDNFFGNGTFVIQLTTDLAYDSNYSNWVAQYTIISGGTISGVGFSASAVTITSASQITPLSVTASGVNVDGTFTVNGQPISGGSGSSFDQSLNTTDDVVFNSALIGDVSIIGNEIAVEDSYGLPATLNLSASELVTKTDLNLSVDTRASTTQTVTDVSNTNQFTVRSLMSGGKFTYSPNEGSSWVDASKFVTGTNVSLTDGMNGNITITLTSNMTYDNMFNRWQADNTIVSGGQNLSYDDYRSYSVILNNSSGDIANYGFDDQGVFTAPTVSTNELLINGAPAGLLTTNQDGSKIIAVDTSNTSVETFTEPTNMSVYRIDNGPGTPKFSFETMDTSWPDASKFKVGTLVSLFDGMNNQTIVVELTSNIAYDSMYSRWAASYNVISGTLYSQASSSSITITNTSGALVNYEFTSSGFIAESALIGEALIGDVSIIGNEIAVEDSYGLPATLNVSASDIVIKSNLDLTIDTSNSITETVTDTSNMNQFTVRSAMMGSSQFTYSPNEGSSWASASKFVTGTLVRLTDPMYGTIIITLTSNMTYDNMDGRWEAGYTTSGYVMTDMRSYSVIVTNESGAVANYGFDDQGVFTTPTISTNNLLVAGSPAGLLTVNEDSSNSIVVGGSVTEDISVASGSFSLNSAGNGLFTYGPNIPSFAESTKFTTGTTIALTNNMYGTAVVQLTSALVYNDGPGRWEATYSVISGSNALDGGMLFGALVTITYNQIGNYRFDNQGTFTSANIIAETALIGDVSVVANTISAIDSYGNADTLVVNGDLTVAGTKIITTTHAVYWDDAQWRGADPSYWGDEANKFYIGTFDTATGNLINSLVPGDVITINNTFDNTTLSFTFVSFTFNGTNQYFITVEETNPGNPQASSPITMNGTIQVTADTAVTPLSVTETGVNVDGTFTVNGLPVTGGSGSSYDQSLNTVDDVVFNSALVGDVSIIGNQISGVDTYGNADTLVVGGDLSVKHTSQSAVTYTNLNWDSATVSGMYVGAPSQITFSDYGNLDSNTESILSSLTAGQQITLVDNDSIQRTYTVASTSTGPGMGGTDVTVNLQEPFNTYAAFTVNKTLTVTTTTLTNTLEVTETGANVTGQLTVDGNLVVVGNLTLADTTEVPTNSATIPVKYAKVIVAGSTYYMPLFQ